MSVVTAGAPGCDLCLSFSARPTFLKHCPRVFLSYPRACSPSIWPPASALPDLRGMIKLFPISRLFPPTLSCPLAGPYTHHTRSSCPSCIQLAPFKAFPLSLVLPALGPSLPSQNLEYGFEVQQSGVQILARSFTSQLSLWAVSQPC